MKRLPRVALLIETSREYGRGLLRGVIAYERQHGPWSIFFRPHGLNEPAPRWLHQWKGQGILARINDRRMAETLSQCNVPVVDLRFALSNLSSDNPKIVQGVGIDNCQVAQLASDHLLERGLRHFGFIGMPRGQNIWSDFRSKEFVRLIEKAGHSCSVFASRSGHHREGTYEHEQEEIIAWVRGLPKPGWGPLDYVPFYGVYTTALPYVGYTIPNTSDPTGIAAMGINIRRPITSITDGTSNTMLLSEDAGRDQHWIMGQNVGPLVADGYEGGFWAAASGSQNFLWMIGWGPGSQANWTIGGPCAINCANGAVGIYAFHTGGANVLLCDGSVHFINQSAPMGIVAGLIAREDGQALSFSNFMN